MRDRIVTYQPDNSLKKGYLAIFREIAGEIKSNRWLTFQLFKRDFFAAYKQSFVGIFWAFLLPLFSIATFMVLNKSGVFDVGVIDVPYPLYALLGMAFWQVFSTGIVSASNALANAGSMITRINFSKKSLVLASIGKALVIFFFQMGLVCLLFIIYRVMPAKGLILLPLMVVPLVLLVLGAGFIFSLFNAFAKDAGNGLNVIMTFLLFVTPILYVKPRTGILAHITKFNPLYYLISSARELALEGRISEPRGFIISAVAAVFISIFCLFMFHLTETRVTERL